MSETTHLVAAYFEVSDTEEERILKAAFSSREPLRLKNFPAKQKRKAVCLQLIATAFESERIYSESEVNIVLANIYDDFVTLRRYLVDFGFLKRTTDGAEYWLQPNSSGAKQ